ncbi:glycoside hydrolase family 26 protein [Glaciibacter sp. 2TAF33]|uniref:glycoside hydrolase family 26 protein n=1 Tax=Glaciibacter sp. 2TAF33 TaxID=3233015 RepID=UPI003F90C0DE
MSEPTWWLRNKSHSRKTGAAVVALGLVLATLSYIVWSSPANPVGQAVGSAVKASEALNPLYASNASLKAQLTAATSKLIARSSELSKQKQLLVTQQASTAKQLAELQQRAIIAEQQVASAKAAVSAAEAAVKNAGGKAGTSARQSGTSSTAASITAPPLEQLLNPASRYYGMYTEQAPFNWATLDATAAQVGVAPNLTGYFSGWDENFRANAVTRSWAKGTMPVMTWESRPIKAGNDVIDEPDYTLPKILGDPAAGTPGAFDDYLHQYAKDIVATGLPLGIRFNHEMNSIWYPWSETDGKGASINGNNRGDYVKVWKHVHDIFEAEGANSLVAWIWAPNIVNNLPATHKTPEYLASLYPGDEYVDWVGLSGYLRPPYKPDNNFTFDYTFGQSLDQLRALTSKPIMLAEIGASETEGHKAAWISSFFDAMAKPENSDIIGFAWFNLAVTSYVEGERATNDWRINSRADTLSAFITGLTRPEANFTLVPAP